MEDAKFRLVLQSGELAECRGEAMEEILKEIKFSKNAIVLYRPNVGEIQVLFTANNAELLEDLIIALCYNESLYKLIKLAVISTDDLKKGKKRGMDFAKLAARYVKKNLNVLE